jgi:hypothetical protein
MSYFVFPEVARAAWQSMSARGVVDGLDADQLISAIARHDPPGAKYSVLAPALLGVRAQIAESDEDLKAALARFAVAGLVANFNPAESKLCLPAAIVGLYPRELERMRRHLQSVDGYHNDVLSDSVCKDIAILSHRMIPVGAEYAQPGAAIPRAVLLRGGPGQLLRGLRAIFMGGGRTGYLELHAHTDALQDFNPDGWQLTYRNLAELIQLNPELRGWYSSSWFLDPAVSEISPRLAYLRRTPGSLPLTYLYVGEDREGTSGALSRSPTRQILFREGRYTPRIFMRICPRSIALSRLRTRDDTSLGDLN